MNTRKLTGSCATIKRDSLERDEEELKPKKSWKDWGHGLSVMIPWSDFDGGDLTLYNLGMEFEMKPSHAILFNAKVVSYAVGQVAKGTGNHLDLVVHGQTMKWLKWKVVTTPIARVAAQVAADVAAKAQQESMVRETEKSPEQKKGENENERMKELAAIAKENARIRAPTTDAMRPPEYAAQRERERKAGDHLRQRALEASNANLQPLGNRNIIPTADPLPQQPRAQDSFAGFEPSDVTRAEPHPERQPEILQPSESQLDTTPMVLDTPNTSFSGSEHKQLQRESLLIPEQNLFYFDFDDSPEPQPSIGFSYEDA